MCDLVKKSEGGPCYFFREGGSISKGGHVSSFERGGGIGMGGPLAWGGGGYDCWRSIKFLFFRPTNGTITCTLPL